MHHPTDSTWFIRPSQLLVRPDLMRTFACLLTLSVLLLFGCAPSDSGPSAEDQAEVRQLLEGYLPAMAEAYRTGNVEVLRPFAVEKEIATLYKRISDFMEQENRIVASTLKGFEVDEIKIWRHSNAVVDTTEIWDVRVLASGSETVLSEGLDQRDKVRYQLKRTDEGWRVIYRERVQTIQQQ